MGNPERLRLITRFRALRNWEAFNIGFFLALLGLWVQRAHPPTWLLTAYSVFIVCFILGQGSLYWHLKARSLQQRQRTLPTWFAPLFTWFHHSTCILLGLFPLIALGLWAMQRMTLRELGWASAIAGFALLEYVNYYHYQLMHDTRNDWRYLLQHHRLRKAPLAIDRARAQRDG